MPQTLEGNIRLRELVKSRPPLRLAHSELLPRRRKGAGGVDYEGAVDDEGNPVIYVDDDQDPTTPPKPVPVPKAPAPKCCEDQSIKADGQVVLVPMFLEVAADAVGGVVSARIPGPGIIEHVTIRCTPTGGAVVVYHWIRIDVGLDSNQQTLTFQDSNIPSGYAPERYSLFQYGANEDTGSGQDGDTQGWYRLGLVVSTGDTECNLPCSLYIPDAEFFIKVYAQNDVAAVEQFSVVLSVRLLTKQKPIKAGKPPIAPPGPSPIKVPGPPLPGIVPGEPPAPKPLAPPPPVVVVKPKYLPGWSSYKLGPPPKGAPKVAGTG